MGRWLRPHSYLNKPAFLWLVATLPAYLLVGIDVASWLWWTLLILFIIATICSSFIIGKHCHPKLSILFALLAWCSAFTLYLTVLEIPYKSFAFPTEPRPYSLRVVERTSGQRPTYILQDRTSTQRFRYTAPSPLPDTLLYGGHLELLAQPLPTNAITSDSFRRYLRSQNIHGTIPSSAHILAARQGTPTFRQRLLRLRARWIYAFDRRSEAHLTPDQRSILYALTLGTAGDMPRDLRRTFTDAGVAHVLAVSGFHLGIILLLTQWLLMRYLYAYRYRYLRAIILMVLLTLYTLFTGASPSTVRALLMAVLALSATLLNRSANAIQVLALTLVLILIVSPYSLFSVGLILSISAVWGIISFLPIFTNLIRPANPQILKLYELLAISVAAQLGVFPWLLYFFGTAGISFIFSAIPITFLATLLIPFGFLIMIVGTMPGITLLHYLLALMQRATLLVSDLSLPSITLRFDLLAVILYYALLVTAYLFFFRLYRRKRLLPSKL